MSYDPSPLDHGRLSYEQAASIAHLSVSLNLLEEVVQRSICQLLRTGKDRLLRKLFLDDLTFAQKVERLRKIVEEVLDEAGLTNGSIRWEATFPDPGLIHTVQALIDALQFAKQSAQIRNSIIHAIPERGYPAATWTQLRTLRGFPSESDPPSILQQLRKTYGAGADIEQLVGYLLDAVSDAGSYSRRAFHCPR